MTDAETDPQPIVIDLADLRTRSLAAVDRLNKMAETHKGETKVRLKGKIEGVHLVLSYLDEAIRIARYSQDDHDEGPTLSPN